MEKGVTVEGHFGKVTSSPITKLLLKKENLARPRGTLNIILS